MTNCDASRLQVTVNRTQSRRTNVNSACSSRLLHARRSYLSIQRIIRQSIPLSIHEFRVSRIYSACWCVCIDEAEQFPWPSRLSPRHLHGNAQALIREPSLSYASRTICITLGPTDKWRFRGKFGRPLSPPLPQTDIKYAVSLIKETLPPLESKESNECFWSFWYWSS